MATTNTRTPEQVQAASYIRMRLKDSSVPVDGQATGACACDTDAPLGFPTEEPHRALVFSQERLEKFEAATVMVLLVRENVEHQQVGVKSVLYVP